MKTSPVDNGGEENVDFELPRIALVNGGSLLFFCVKLIVDPLVAAIKPSSPSETLVLPSVVPLMLPSFRPLVSSSRLLQGAWVSPLNGKFIPSKLRFLDLSDVISPSESTNLVDDCFSVTRISIFSIDGSIRVAVKLDRND